MPSVIRPSDRKIVQIPFGIQIIPDGQNRRYLSWGMSFDTRAVLLDDIQDHWEPHVKKLNARNRERVIEGLLHEFGVQESQQKIKNFKDLDTKPFSIVAEHTEFFDHVRRAFVVSAYYPALVGACSLGGRF